MTHAFVVDKRAKSTTSGMEVQVPVTVIEVPPMKIAAVRFYENTIIGLKTAGEVWAADADVDPLLKRRVNVPKRGEPDFGKFDNMDVEDVRVLAYTQPKLVSGVPKKVPDLMELRIGGGKRGSSTPRASSAKRSPSPTSHPREHSSTSSPSPPERDSRESPRGGVSSCFPTRTASTAVESPTSDLRGPDT